MPNLVAGLPGGRLGAASLTDVHRHDLHRRQPERPEGTGRRLGHGVRRRLQLVVHDHGAGT